MEFWIQPRNKNSNIIQKHVVNMNEIQNKVLPDIEKQNYSS